MTYATSSAGLALIQKYEGFHAAPAQLPNGNWVVGYGHVRIGEAGGAVTKAEAGHLLALDLAPVEHLVNGKVTQKLNQSQFDALVSFAFSLGAEAFARSQVLRRVNSGDVLAAACAMDAWRKSDVSGELEIIGALVARRAAEKALFLQELPHDASPSVFMRAKLDYAASVLGAPIKYAAAPEIRAIAAALPKREPGRRLTEILKSEAATATLLLTQVAVDADLEDEITTAHAKPVARALDRARDARNQTPRFSLPRFDPSHSLENVGLIALLAFGLGITFIAGSMLFAGQGDAIDIAVGAALAAPGFAASLMAGFGLWRGPQAKLVEARTISRLFP